MSIVSVHGLSIGSHFHVGRNSLIEVDGVIGDGVLMSSFVKIVGRFDHAFRELNVPVRYSTSIRDRKSESKDRIVIGDDVWVGCDVTILSGVRVGHGSIVAAGSLVISDIPDFSIVAGQPARVVGERFAADEQAPHLDVVRARLSRL